MTDWETNSGPLGIEYGAPVGGISTVGGRLPEFTKAAPEPFTDGQTIEGVACTYLTLHAHKGGYEMFDRNCFARSLTSDRAVRLILDHQESKLVATTADDLELWTTADELKFRYRVRDTEMGRKAAQMVGDGTLPEMSVGYRILVSDVIDADGEPVKVIKDAELMEISIVTRGAVKGTSAWLFEPGAAGVLASYDRMNKNLDDLQLVFEAKRRRMAELVRLLG